MAKNNNPQFLACNRRRLEVVERGLNTLQPYPNNARTHSRKQISQIAKSIEVFGFLIPVLTDGEGTIIAGHGRIEAAKLLGMEKVPTISIEHLTEKQIRAFMIADNRLAELAEWDSEILAHEFMALSGLDLDFDIQITGFELPEIDLLIEGAGEEKPDIADDIPEMDETRPPVSRAGDIWLLGDHRLSCGDATDGSVYARLMEGEKAQMVITDPPYNVPIDGHVSGLGSVRHREFAMASGEMSSSEFTGFLKAVFGHVARFSLDGSVHYVFMDWRHMDEILAAGRAVYSDLLNLCIWNKSNGGMGSLYRSKHELVFIFKNGRAPHINNVQLGRHGRNRTNVWDYAGVNSLTADRADKLRMHPTVKPVTLVADAMLDCSDRGGLVLDPFCGSGTVIMAAERVGRRAAAIEIDPLYVDVAIRRWQAYTGSGAIHAESGRGFAEIAQQRSLDQPGPDAVLGATETEIEGQIEFRAVDTDPTWPGPIILREAPDG